MLVATVSSWELYRTGSVADLRGNTALFLLNNYKLLLYFS